MEALLGTIVHGSFAAYFGAVTRNIWNDEHASIGGLDCTLLFSVGCLACAFTSITTSYIKRRHTGGLIERNYEQEYAASRNRRGFVEAPDEASLTDAAVSPWEVAELQFLGPFVAFIFQAMIWSLHLSSSPLRWITFFCWSASLAVTHNVLFLRSMFGGSERVHTILSVVRELAQLVAAAFCLGASVAAASGHSLSVAVETVGSGNSGVLYSQSFSLRMSLGVGTLLLMYAMSKCVPRISSSLRPFMSVFYLTFHIFALVGIHRWFTHVPTSAEIPSRRRLAAEMTIMYLMGGIGITAGAHRLWAHKAYKANLPYRIIVMLFDSVATQGSILDWARDHRLHHRYSEKEPDPHNALKGFFYAHVGWLLTKRPTAVEAAVHHVDVSDLLQDSVVMFQKALNPYWNLAVCFLLPSVYTQWIYGDFWLGFFTIGCFRWIFTLHCTWCVNSVAHLWGPRPYNENIGPVESLFTAIVAVGEGWHNWHHQYPFDYVAAEDGALRQYNPTKIFIDFFAAIGWVWGRKRATRLWEQTKKKRAETQRAALEAIHKATLESRLNSRNDSATATTAASSVGETPSMQDLVDYEKSTLTASIETLTSLIPAGCHRVSLLKSTLYLLRDLISATVISAVCAAIWVAVSHYRATSATSLWQDVFLKLLECAIFIVYSLAQGTVMMAVWVAAYECAGGRFARCKSVNIALGFFLSVLLCIPYHSRRHEQNMKKPRRSEKSPGAVHLCRALHEDILSIFHVDRWTSFSLTSSLPVGGISAVLSLTAVGACVRVFGWRSIACWYFGSWCVMNLWQLLYHHHLLIKVHKTFSKLHLAAPIAAASPSGADTAANAEKQKTLEEVLKDTAPEEDLSKIPKTGLFVDPHSLSELQREAELLKAQPLSSKTVEFFTHEWMLSAVEVFDRIVLVNPEPNLPSGKADGTAKKSTAGSPAEPSSHVRFLVRLLLFFFGSLHHNLVQVNILQSIDIRIPHYHARDAVTALLSYARAAQKATAAAAAAVPMPSIGCTVSASTTGPPPKNVDAN